MNEHKAIIKAIVFIKTMNSMKGLYKLNKYNRRNRRMAITRKSFGLHYNFEYGE